MPGSRRYFGLVPSLVGLLLPAISDQKYGLLSPGLSTSTDRDGDVDMKI